MDQLTSTIATMPLTSAAKVEGEGNHQVNEESPASVSGITVASTGLLSQKLSASTGSPEETSPLHTFSSASTANLNDGDFVSGTLKTSSQGSSTSSLSSFSVATLTSPADASTSVPRALPSTTATGGEASLASAALNNGSESSSQLVKTYHAPDASASTSPSTCDVASLNGESSLNDAARDPCVTELRLGSHQLR